MPLVRPGYASDVPRSSSRKWMLPRGASHLHHFFWCSKVGLMFCTITVAGITRMGLEGKRKADDADDSRGQV